MLMVDIFSAMQMHCVYHFDENGNINLKMSDYE